MTRDGIIPKKLGRCKACGFHGLTQRGLCVVCIQPPKPRRDDPADGPRSGRPAMLGDDRVSTAETIGGETWEEWAGRMFEFENCAECRRGLRSHLPAVTVLGNWFALCKPKAARRRGRP